MKNMKLALGGLIAVALLGLFVYSVVDAIVVVERSIAAKGALHTDKIAGLTQALTTIGSLVSALVVTELAMTPPGEVPVARVLAATTTTDRTRKSVEWIAAVYVVFWVLTGMAAYVVGQMRHPGALQPLTDLAQSWLGLAIAATYTYFGIKPAGQGDRQDPEHAPLASAAPKLQAKP